MSTVPTTIELDFFHGGQDQFVPVRRALPSSVGDLGGERLRNQWLKAMDIAGAARDAVSTTVTDVILTGAQALAPDIAAEAEHLFGRTRQARRATDLSGRTRGIPSGLCQPCPTNGTPTGRTPGIPSPHPAGPPGSGRRRERAWSTPDYTGTT
jgi:hypothetical protein